MREEQTNNDDSYSEENRANSILIVDDNPDDLSLLSKLLIPHKYRVRCFLNVLVGIDSALQYPPALIILDILIPGYNGYEICDTLKRDSRTSHIPIIFISALKETEDKVYGFERGAVDFITKPFQAEEVIARVATHFSIQKMRRQLQEHNDQLQEEIVRRQQTEVALRQEITRRQQTEEALRESQKFITRITETIPALAYVYDLEKQHYIYINRAIPTLFDYVAKADFQKSHEQWEYPIHPDDLPLVVSHIQQLMSASTDQLFECEYRIRQSDQSWLWFHHYDSVFTRHSDGTPHHIIGIVIDATDQRISAQMILEQAQTLSILQERERLTRELHDTHGQVLGSVNAQSQTIRMFLQNGEVHRALPILKNVIETTQHTQQNIRDFILGTRSASRLHNTEGQEQQFVSALRVFCNGLQHSYGFATILHIAESVEHTTFSPVQAVQLFRVAQESLTNVRKHAGVMQAHITLSATDTILEMQIADKGCGFDVAHYTDNESADHHTRYGLQSIRGRVADMGGDITINSTLGEGTTISVSIPLQETQGNNRYEILNLSLLLVDDNERFVQSLQQMLEAHHVQVVGTASNGKEALEQTRLLQPDVILMDIDMPEMDGLVATQQIHQEHPDIPIVMLTISDDDESVFEAIKCGASGYLTKDLQVDKMLQLLIGLSFGEVPLSPGLAARILNEFATHKSVQPDSLSQNADSDEVDSTIITDHQKEILTLVAAGFTYQQVGKRLNYSNETIRYHMRKVLKKLRLKNRSDAVAYVQEQIARGVWRPS